MWTCSRGRAIVLRALAPEKGRRGDLDEWVLQSSTLWLQLCTTHLLDRDPWDRGMGGAECIHPLMQHMLPSGPPLLPRGTEQGWLQQQHHGAAPWAGGSQLCALKQLDRVTLRGKVAQPAPGVLSICFAHFQNQSWLESFFSSCRNLQSLAHSPICHFVLHHALFQEVELAMIS